MHCSIVSNKSSLATQRCPKIQDGMHRKFETDNLFHLSLLLNVIFTLSGKIYNLGIISSYSESTSLNSRGSFEDFCNEKTSKNKTLGKCKKSSSITASKMLQLTGVDYMYVLSPEEGVNDH